MNEVSIEKRNIGEAWEKASDGKCFIVMPKRPDFDLIRAKTKQLNSPRTGMCGYERPAEPPY